MTGVLRIVKSMRSLLVVAELQVCASCAGEAAGISSFAFVFRKAAWLARNAILFNLEEDDVHNCECLVIVSSGTGE